MYIFCTVLFFVDGHICIPPTRLFRKIIPWRSRVAYIFFTKSLINLIPNRIIIRISPLRDRHENTGHNITDFERNEKDIFFFISPRKWLFGFMKTLREFGTARISHPTTTRRYFIRNIFYRDMFRTCVLDLVWKKKINFRFPSVTRIKLTPSFRYNTANKCPLCDRNNITEFRILYFAIFFFFASELVTIARNSHYRNELCAYNVYNTYIIL